MFEKELNQQYLIEITQNMLYGKKEEFSKEYDTCSFWELARRHRMDHAIRHYFSTWSDFKSNHSIDVYVEPDVYLEELKKICQRFNQEKMEYRVVKGIFLSECVFHDLFYRNVGDIDLVVQEDDFHRAYYVMREMGYSLTDELGDDGPKLTLGINFHEMKMRKENIVAEIKRGVSAIDTNFKPWFSNYRTVEVDGLSIYTLDEFHTVLLMFSQAFVNNEGKVVFYKCRLRDYFDVAYHMINNVNFDWGCLRKLADKYELTHQIFAVMRSVNQIYSLPEAFKRNIMDLFNPLTLSYKRTFFYYNEDSIA